MSSSSLCKFLLGSLLLVPCRLAGQDDLGWGQLNVTFRELTARGNYSDAAGVANKQLEIAQAAWGPEHPLVAASLVNLALTYQYQQKYTEAETLIQRAVKIDERTLGPKHPDVGVALTNLGSVQMAEGHYSEAASSLSRALSIIEEALGQQHPLVATVLHYQANLYHAQGRYADAQAVLERAMAIREKEVGSDHPRIALLMNDVAAEYLGQGKYADAERLFKRAIAIFETAGQLNSPDYATTLMNLASVYLHQARYSDAEALYDRALKAMQRSVAPNDPRLAKVLNNQGMANGSVGKYADAESLLKRSLNIYERAFGPDHPEVATGLSNLAQVYSAEGRSADAVPLLERALKIDEKALGPEHPDTASIMVAFSEECRNDGNYARAEELLNRAVKVREKVSGPNGLEVADALSDLGLVYHFEAKFRDAESVFNRSLGIYETTLGKDNTQVAVALTNLGGAYCDETQFKEAEPLLRRALTIQQNALAADDPRLAATLNDLAYVLERNGKVTEAEDLYKRSLTIAEKAFGADHPDVGAAKLNLAALYYLHGRPDLAGALFEEVLTNLSHQIDQHFTYMNEKERLSFLHSLNARLAAYFSYCVDNVASNPALASRMYDAVVWRKGLVGNSISALRAQIAASGNAEALKTLGQLADKRTQLAALVNERGDMPQRRPAIYQLEKESDELERQLVKQAGAPVDAERLTGVTWQDVRHALGPNDVAIEFVRSQSYKSIYENAFSQDAFYVALVVTPQTTATPILVFLGQASQLEGEPLADYRRWIAKVPAKGAGIHFYQAFWKPLEPYLQQNGRVYVSPDGVLNEVSLEVVPAENGQLLMDKYNLEMVLSTKDLLRGPHLGAENTAVLVGNPTFNLDVAAQKAELQKLVSAQAGTVEAALNINPSSISRSASANEDCPDRPKGGLLCPLPGTQKEVDGIFVQLQKAKWDVRPPYTEGKALKEVVRQLHHPRVLHVATHGFFSPEQRRGDVGFGTHQTVILEDPMLRSGLFFAGADRTLRGETSASDGDDGVLTAYEASMLDLHGTEMVVLSACETGVGEIRNGEGVFGLRRALQEAGADAVLMSMWSVPDDETQELMSLFYEKWLGGKTKHDALRETEREMRERIKARWEGEDRPYYWGAFVLVDR